MKEEKAFFQVFNFHIPFVVSGFCRVSDESGSLEMTPVNEMPLKKEHLDSYVSRNLVSS